VSEAPVSRLDCGCSYRLLRGYPLTFTSMIRCTEARTMFAPRVMAEHLGLREGADEPEPIEEAPDGH
jgi:hypothetical protein